MRFTTKPMIPIDFAPGITEKVGEKVVGFGGSNVLIVTDGILVELGIVDNVMDSLDNFGIDYVVFDNVIPDPPEYLVYDSVKMYNANECDMIIALGGGSSMDVGKMTKLMIANEGSLTEYCDFYKPQNIGPKLICMPTTSGTGSEITVAAAFTNVEAQAKLCVAGPGVQADLALVDPELASTMPSKVTISTGFDTLTHAVEAYICNMANGYADMFSEKAIALTLKYLDLAAKDGENINYRSEISRACTFAGIAISDASIAAAHSMAHSIGATYHIPHGIACSIVLPWYLEYITPVVEKRIRDLIGMFGGDSNIEREKLGETIRELVIDYAQYLNLPLFYEISGASEEDFDELSHKAKLDICGFFSPKMLEIPDYKLLFKKMFEYRR
mgnify:CR=1 FL=1